MKKKIAIVLPYKEIFSKNYAGAASIWVKDYNDCLLYTSPSPRDPE